MILKIKIFKAIFLVTIFVTSLLYPQTINFKNLTTKDGLSNNKINAILQDKTGFLWFGTDDGLNRFDGYDFKVYRNNPKDSNSISSNNIWSLFEDDEGNIWIGTKSGDLNFYDSEKEIFKHWKIESEVVRENSITALYKIKNDYVWIGTYQSGLYRFNIKSGELKNWNYKINDINCISNNFVTSIVEDNNGSLWISTYNGLNKFNPNSTEDKFQKFYAEQGYPNSLSSNLIWSITKSKYYPDLMWIGTANGLVSLDNDKNIFTRFHFAIEKSLQFSSSVASVVEEKINDATILWISTYGGLVRLNFTTQESARFIKQKNDPYSIISNEINDVLKDRSGAVWLATENGISYFSHKSQKFNNLFSVQSGVQKFNVIIKSNVKAFDKNPDGTIFFGTANGVYGYSSSSSQPLIKNYNFATQLNVWSLASTNDYLWVGTYGQGLKQLNLKNGSVKNWEIESPTFKTSAFEYLKSMYLDEDKNLWIGFWGGGLARFNTNTDKYKIWITESGNSNSISHNDVWAIHKDKKGRMWIGTNGGGLNLFEDTNGGKFQRWIDVLDKSKQLSSNSIYSICESKQRNDTSKNEETILWAGTSNGLNKVVIHNSSDLYNLKSLKIEVSSFTTQNGLADNSVKSILEDKNGNLWIGTNSGISFFDVLKESFVNYNNSDGIIGNEFNSGSAFYSNNGLMYFGSIEGLNVFNPDHIRQSEFIPPIVITDFQIFNEPVKIGEDSPLNTSILNIKKIVLAYSQNVFSFQFAALDYNSPQSIHYAYQMEGFDKEWVYTDDRRFISYTNLDPGTYQFKVKATNSDGVWNNNFKSITIIINQPWWRTGWAYAFYVLLIIVGIFTARKIETNRARLRNELKMREFEAKKQRELEIIKARFFANLSHEFRTPLTLIKGPIDELISGVSKENQQEYFELIKRNSEKLQELIDQLLELTQLENAAIPLKARKENLVNLLRGLVSSFDSMAKEKNINLLFKNSLEKILCWVDRDKMEKIINNLLSNAFKFTGIGGSIRVQLESQVNNDEKFAIVKISDTGIGIPKDKLDKIFDRFYQVDDSSRKNHSGSGIGLALVKELVDLHKWEIDVESEQGKGTTFYLQIPLSETYLDETLKEIEVSLEKYGGIDSDKTEITSKETDQLEKEIEQEILEKKKLLGEKPSVLIIEDSMDVRIFLRGILQNDYTIYEAIDGEDGLKKAAESMPSLIISDVMMPSINGIEFCRRIKTDWQTSHIPVILLTAKASEESKLEGLEMGADAYLTKPFSTKELSVRVKNLLAQRKKLLEKFSKEIKIDTSTIAVTSVDNEFFQKVLSVAEQNLSNTDFNSENFAQEMFMSRSQLHRKLVSVTGQGPGEFIRTFRLKRSASLILEKRLSITQIAFEVGFSSPSHFTKSFRQQFNCLPTEFIQKNNS